MITYGQLFQYVRPFFLSRWGGAFANDEQLMTYANMAIQDIYNLDESTFTYEVVTLPLTKVGNDFVGNTDYDIRKVEECFDKNGREYVPTLYNFEADDQFRISGNTITLAGRILMTYGSPEWHNVNEDIDHLNVCYIRDYKWRDSKLDMTDVIPLPNRYVPALVKLMYDWAAPISMLAGETATTDFFSHAMNRLKELRENDGLTNTPRIKTNRQNQWKMYH